MPHLEISRVTNLLQASVIAVTLLGAFAPANAGEITIHDVSLYNDHYGINQWFGGASDETFANFRAFVTPSPDTELPLGADTSVVATHSNLNTDLFIGYNGPTHAPQFGVTGGAGFSNSYNRLIPQQFFIDNPIFQSGWAVEASNPNVNGGTAVSSALPNLDISLTPDIVKNVAISGTSEAPTFSWKLPDESLHNQMSIGIWRIDVPAVEAGGFPTLVHAALGTPGQQAFDVPDTLNLGVEGNATLDPDGHYMIGIQLDVYEEDAQGDPQLSFDGLRGRARSFHEFSPSVAQPDGPVELPQVDTDGTFHFDFTVDENETYFIDPLVAVGYDYEIGIGDPLFASFILPEIGDDFFDLYLFDETLNDFVFEAVVEAGIEFIFSSPVALFRILGIETGAELDPSDPAAFVTGLTFNDSGNFTGTMTPISVFVSEPGALGLLALGFASLRLRRRKAIAT